MRVISGSAGGITLRSPKGDATRPTTDRVRSSVFSILGSLVEEAAVLDLFAGSGTLGIECLSRGAASATFVEAGREACDFIRDNLGRTRLEGGRIVNQSVERYLKSQAAAPSPRRFDLVFADPPYAKRPGDTDHTALLLASADLPRLISAAGLFIIEVPRDRRDPESETWELVDARNYGTNMIQFFRLREDAAGETTR